MQRWEEFDGGTPRAPRFPLEFRLQYRPGEVGPWREGRGTNISRSGLLFQAGEPLLMRAQVEVTFVMPVKIPGESAVTVICQGHVVRQSPGTTQGGVAVATTIETYRFQRPEGNLPA